MNHKNEIFWVYALRSAVKSYIYVGMTKELDRRIEEHNSGSEQTTRPYRPLLLIHSERFSDRTSAREREKYLKSGFGKEFLKSLP